MINTGQFVKGHIPICPFKKGHKINFGRKMTAYTKMCLIQANTGRKVIHSPETCKKISESRRGIKFTDEHRKNLSLALIGREVWNKGLKGYMGGLTPFPKGNIPWNKGLKGFMGEEKNWRWKGGVSKNRLYRNKWRTEDRHKHPEKVRVMNHNRRLKTSTLDIKTIQMVYEDNIKQFGTLTCYLCLKPIEFKKDHLEHRIPLSRGGNNEYNNLAIACQHCNCKKNIKTETEYKKECANWQSQA